jgi:hypothetical protein
MPLGLCEVSAGTIDLSGPGASPLEQPRASMILEQLSIAHVAP